MAKQLGLFGRRGLRKQRRGQALASPEDPALAEAMRDAKDILEWSLGPNVPGWRVYRLAQAMKNA